MTTKLSGKTVMKSKTTYICNVFACAITLAACGSAGPAAAKSPTEVPTGTAEHQLPEEGKEHTSTEVPLVEQDMVEPVSVKPAISEDFLAVEVAAYQSARLVFEEECGGCHTPDSTRKKPKKAVAHFSMGSYPFAGHHQSELGRSIRMAIGGTGKPATMPKDAPGSLAGEDLKVLLAWADAFDMAAEAGVGYHAGNERTDDDMKEASKHEHKASKHKHKATHRHGKKHEH